MMRLVSAECKLDVINGQYQVSAYFYECTECRGITKANDYTPPKCIHCHMPIRRIKP